MKLLLIYIIIDIILIAWMLDLVRPKAGWIFATIIWFTGFSTGYLFKKFKNEIKAKTGQPDPDRPHT